ncbi:MAG TPA: hypothetical protein VGB24_16235 [Longimicrobium sp.]|jgi:hypothetical protein|uniref:hypothetical protein n=1 Tax=Longimicrobium sp. TaxID=2029185 RepID=UPI002EDB391B
MHYRFAPAFFATLLLVGCGDATGPRTYAEVQGTYDVSAPIAEVPGARFSGTMTIVDDSRDTPEFGGTYTLSLIGADGANHGRFTGDLVNGAVTGAGSVRFYLDDDKFRWSGAVSDEGGVTGTWVLANAASNYTGTFVAATR